MKDVADEKGHTTATQFDEPDDSAKGNLMDFARVHLASMRARDRASAQKVFDAYEGGLSSFRSDSRAMSSEAVLRWHRDTDEAIREHLNVSSLGHFIKLILESRQRAAQAARAGIRHAENRSMKADVFSWLDQNFASFNSVDSAAEAIAGKVCPIKWRTARDWIDQWKALRSAGTP